MTRNTPEFDEAILNAMKQLEDEGTDIALQAVGHVDGNIQTSVCYNTNSNVPEEGLVALLAAITLAIEPKYEESVGKILAEVEKTADSMDLQ